MRIVFLVGFLLFSVVDPSMGRDTRRLIIPHRPNYILPLTFVTDINERPFQLNGNPLDADHTEAKFQISLKFPFIKGMFNNYGTMYIAYTQKSLWQVYNDENSKPFRTTDYEPEAYVSFDTDTPFLGLTNRIINFGISHQSNGQREKALSRSWNRIYTEFILDYNELFVSVKPWWRLPVSDRSDDNPGIERYTGYGEITLAYPIYEHVISAVWRNNLRANSNKGALELNWSFPLKGQVRGFIQGFTGYAESLLDYNVPVDRIGFGFLISDWI